MGKSWAESGGHVRVTRVPRIHLADNDQLCTSPLHLMLYRWSCGPRVVWILNVGWSFVGHRVRRPCRRSDARFADLAGGSHRW